MPTLWVSVPAPTLLSLKPLQSIVTLLLWISMARALLALMARSFWRHQVPWTVMTVGSAVTSPLQLSSLSAAGAGAAIPTNAIDSTATVIGLRDARIDRPPFLFFAAISLASRQHPIQPLAIHH